MSIILAALQWFLGDQLHNRWHLVSVQAPAHSQLFSIAQWTIIIPTGVNTPLFGSGVMLLIVGQSVEHNGHIIHMKDVTLNMGNLTAALS